MGVNTRKNGGHLAHGRDYYWRTLVNAPLNLWVPKPMELVSLLFLNRSLVHERAFYLVNAELYLQYRSTWTNIWFILLYQNIYH